jgi:hypothetical protein
LKADRIDFIDPMKVGSVWSCYGRDVCAVIWAQVRGCDGGSRVLVVDGKTAFSGVGEEEVEFVAACVVYDFWQLVAFDILDIQSSLRGDLPSNLHRLVALMFVFCNLKSGVVGRI